MSRQPKFDSYVEGKLSEDQKPKLYADMVDCVVSVELYVHLQDHGFYDCQGVDLIVSPQGHILTLSHMVNDDMNASVQVKTSKGDVYSVHILSVNVNLGLAMLEIVSKRNVTFPCATISDTELSFGQKVYPIGHPGYLDFSYPIGHISFPCRYYAAVQESVKILLKFVQEDVRDKVESSTDEDSGGDNKDMEHIRFIRHIDDLSELKLSGSLPLVQVNNVHGDGMEGSSGMPFFSHDGLVVGMYLFEARDQVFGIHAKTLKSFVDGQLTRA